MNSRDAEENLPEGQKSEDVENSVDFSTNVCAIADGSIFDCDSAKVPRADELTGEQLEEFAFNFRLVSLMENGKSASAALRHLAHEFPQNKVRTERWAQQKYKDYKENDASVLLDKRRRRRPIASVLVTEVIKLLLAWWYARPAAGPKAIWLKVVEECRTRKFPEPGYDAVRKFIKSLPKHDHLVREGKIHIWSKQGRPVARFDMTSYANERWQIDHTRLDIWVREKVDGEWIPCEVRGSLILDAHTRTVPNFTVSQTHPDAWTTSILLRGAILPKHRSDWRNRGMPAVLQPDRGKDFMSHAVAASLAYLGIILDPDPPYYPDRKGRIERFIRTLDTGCLRILPGHHKAVGVTKEAAMKHVSTLLTRQQLVREIERWIVEDYHMRIHSETGRRPAEHWEETVRLRMPESEDALDNLLLKNDVARKVRNTGIDFHVKGRGGRYWAPELIYHWSREVSLRYNPEDLQSVLVYCASTGEYLCEAWLMGQEDSKFTIADIKRTRNQFRRGLIERMKDYAEEIHREDRRAARQVEWDAAREAADEQAKNCEDETEIHVSDSEVDALIVQFERQDRGEK